MSNIIHPINWNCLGCGCRVIVEVAVDSTVHTRVNGLDDKGNLVLGAHVDVALGQPLRYECSACGSIVRNGVVEITGRRELADYLKRFS